MEKYYVEINDEEYEVTVRNESKSQEIKGLSNTTDTNSKYSINKNNSDDKFQKINDNNTNLGKENLFPVESPMSGSILSIEVSEGDKIEKDEVVIIIEAMKMETEIFAPTKGEIADIKAKVGNHCKQGEELALIKEIGGQ